MNEAPPSSYAAKTIALTAELARDLQAAIAGKLPAKPTVSNSLLFGDIYFGSLTGLFKSFAEGRPHYGMVKGRLWSRRNLPPEVPFAPITSQRRSHRENMTLLLPLGTLPDPKKKGEKKISVILLYMVIPIPQRQIEDFSDDNRMRYIERLANPFIEQARAILARL